MNQSAPFTHAFYELPITASQFPVKAGEMDGSQPFLYHWHDGVELLYGLEKTTSVGVMGQSYILREGDLLVIGQGESHCVFPSDHRARRVCVVFEPGLLFSGARFLPYRDCFSQIPKHSGDWPEETKQKAKDAVFHIYGECSRQQPGWDLMVCAHLSGMAATFLRTLPKTEAPYHPSGDSLLRKDLRYLSAEYQDDISLDSCAKALGFHPAYLSHQFKKKMGVSFHRYLVNLRLIKAEALLEQDDLSVALAAGQAGFSSIKTFYRAFYEKHGISPGEYRRLRGRD